ncbi:undecaprenyl-diphosphate phosphatase [Alloprevotella sp. OH1205_COT-284]|uniref:undecaprenyl-diphosphate phosphatase n=1 Tax=Alloprevotella sp. OH1205_COT-284 TaxID=2491043 RepID=UPI000F5FDA2D|nr:undecaprenyl-diphosphate phosphatase [Alloprevotella sp. OH1205_COT-284]RRD80777.1 undecaprenyl-diphosphate phosphatase [Alloprevotella sp. OH1205_COT-284]
MTLFETIVIAIVEGLTEFLPVSSTGHMIITQGVLGMESTPFLKAFTVIIQFGAILSVVCLYWRKFFYPEVKSDKGQTWWGSIWRFYLKLIVGVLPAVVLGLAFNDFIESNLGNVPLVAVMLILGGVFMLFCDRIFNRGSDDTPLTYKRAFVIGLIQCVSMIPGVSRSLSTIVGGMAQKLTRRAAAEFSFFLAVPTMFGATVLETYKLVKHGDGNILMEGNNLTLLLVGCVVAFIVAILAIKFFIDYVARYGFRAFGWYRIVVGILILVLPFFGYELKMEDSAEPVAAERTTTPDA